MERLRNKKERKHKGAEENDKSKTVTATNLGCLTTVNWKYPISFTFKCISVKAIMFKMTSLWIFPLSDEYSRIRQLEVDTMLYTFSQKKKEFSSDGFTFYREL